MGYPNLLAEVFSRPATDRWPWRSESPLPLGNYRCHYTEAADLRAVAYEGRVAVIGIDGAPPLALAGGGWTELSPLPSSPAGQAVTATLALYSI